MPLFEPKALKTVKAWFAAHARGDLDAARALYAPDGVLRVTSPEPGASGEAVGFDGFVEWYANRGRRGGGDLGYRVDELLSSDQRVVAVITLRDGEREWRQLALYEVTDKRITQIWAFEGGP
jgi:ketosteroid isomerase-like protein